MALPEVKDISVTEVPVIDLSDLYSGDARRYREIATQITEACQGLGFFYVTNHGIEQAKIDRVFAVAKQFFALPVEQKMEIYLGKSPNYRGYLPFKMMGMDPSLKGNLHEAFQIHPELGPDDPDVIAGKRLHGPNQWPAALPELRESMMDYYRDMLRLSNQFLRMFAVGLDLEPETFLKYFRKPMTMHRVMHYPPQAPSDPGDSVGTRPHTDSGAFTFLYQDNIGGLEILDREGNWIRVPPLEGAFVINIGEMMKVWTDGLFSATPHRVITRYGEDRYSMPFIATPDFDAVIVPLMENTSTQVDAPTFATSVERGKPITCGEILLKVYGRIWPSPTMERTDG